MQFHSIDANTTWNNTQGVNNPYGESYSYDADGNIARLNHNGWLMLKTLLHQLTIPKTLMDNHPVIINMIRLAT